MDYRKMFYDIYNGIKGMIESMQSFVKWLNSPIIPNWNGPLNPVTTTIVESPFDNMFGQLNWDSFWNMFPRMFEYVVGKMIETILKLPVDMINFFANKLNIDLYQITPAYLVIGNGILILVGLKIVKAIVPFM